MELLCGIGGRIVFEVEDGGARCFHGGNPTFEFYLLRVQHNHIVSIIGTEPKQTSITCAHLRYAFPLCLFFSLCDT